MKKKSCYIVTKPIQYINATNIEDDNDKDCFITDTFFDANKFAKEMQKKSNYWNNIFLVHSKYKVLFRLLFHQYKYSNLFLDSDVGIILRILLILLYPIKIYVYEEGLASYLPEIRLNEKINKNSCKAFIDSYLGNNWSGGSFRTRGIYLYHPTAFKSLVNNCINKELISFKLPLIDHLKSLTDINSFYSLNNIDLFRNKKILLYITSWTINQQYIGIYKEYSDYIKVIKLHPHIKKDINSIELLHFDFYPASTLPAEILICSLIDVAEKIVIIHEGSAAMLNFVGNEKITEFNIADSEYSELYFKIKNEFENELYL